MWNNTVYCRSLIFITFISDRQYWKVKNHLCMNEHAVRAMRERKTYSFLKTSNLLPCFHVFASRLQELLVGQVEGLPNGQSYLFRLQQESKVLIVLSSFLCYIRSFMKNNMVLLQLAVRLSQKDTYTLFTVKHVAEMFVGFRVLANKSEYPFICFVICTEGYPV